MKGVIKTTAFILAVMAFAFIAPVFAYPEGPPTAADYYPLEPGNSWSYHFGGENGTARYEIKRYSDEYKGYLVKRSAKMIDISLVTELIIGDRGGAVTLIGGTEIASGNLRHIYFHPEVILNSPLKAGAAWEYEKESLDNGLMCRVKCRVVKVSDMDVKAGHFGNVCMVERVSSYRDKDDAEQYREVHNEYYAPHVGMIREELVEDANDAIRVGHAVPLDPPAVLLELVSYNVK